MCLTTLDMIKIWGPLVWIVYKDLLNYDAPKMVELCMDGSLRKVIQNRCLNDPGFKHEWEYTKTAIGQ